MSIIYTFGNNIYINLTNRCNLRCTFCLRQRHDSVGDSGSLWLTQEPEVDEIIKAILKRGFSACDNIVFCGFGEPTFRHNDIVKISSILKSYSCPPIRLDTNGHGSIINGRNIAPEYEGLIDIISISLNAPGAEKYVSLCSPAGGEADYYNVLDFTREAACYIPTVIMTAVDRYLTKAELNECEKIAKNLGVGFRIRSYIE